MPIAITTNKNALKQKIELDCSNNLYSDSKDRTQIKLRKAQVITTEYFLDNLFELFK